MQLTIKIYLIILYQSFELLTSTRSDHVQVIGCAKNPHCLNNLNKQLLEIIQENMETKTQPCEHFWNYACGSWTSAPYNDHVDNFGAMANYYADNLIETLKQLQTQDSKLDKLVKQLMTYFESCKSIKFTQLNYALYLQELPVKEIFGESFRWDHLFQEDIWQEFDWLKAAALLRRYGFKGAFLQESPGFARLNSQQHVVQLKIPHTEMEFHNRYQILQIMHKFDLIFEQNTTKNYFQLADELIQFDHKLQHLYKTYKKGKEDYKILLQDFSFQFESIDLYFEQLLNQILSPQTLLEFSGDFQYFHELAALLQTTSRTVQGTYMLLKFCQYLIEIRPTITDQDCMLHTQVMFPVGVEYIYDRFLYENRLEDEQVLFYTFAQLKKEFDGMIMENKFEFDLAEIRQLREKLKRMNLKIGNLPSDLNDTSINLYYSGIQLKDYNFYHNHLEMLKFRTWQQHQALIDPALSAVSVENFYVNDDISQLRNAPYFIHQRNMIVVPLLFLQLPFYHYDQHPLLQFSLVGWILAHELSHAFDHHGLDFDGWGNENPAGNKIATKASFNSAMHCLVAQLPAVSLNERMADVNGLQLAFQTFFHHVARESQNALMLQKLFFINFAQFFCGSLPRAIGHDRDDIRVRQSIANMREFGEVFQCSATAKENPPRKCNIWRT